jgi:O-antigen/teichoic acid export membrane protein
MKLSSHLDKGFWALADRGLLSIYAVAQIAIARVLGLEQYGTYVIFQVIFNMLSSFTDNFALQAIVKYGVEPEIELEALVTTTTILFFSFLAPILLIFNIFPSTIAGILGNERLANLFPLLALFVLTSTPRVIFSKLLQMRFRMRDIFFVDFVNYGLGGLGLGLAVIFHRISVAQDVIWIMIFTAALSSVVATFFGRRHMKLRVRFSGPMFSRIKEFVRYQAITGLVSVFQQNIDSLAVSTFTGAVGAAIYGAAKNVYRMFDVMRDTITLLVFPATSKYYALGDRATVRKIIEKAVGFLYVALIPGLILLFIFTPVLFHLIFGHKFDDSIGVFRILVSGAIVLPIQMVFITTMVGMGRVKEMFRFIASGLTINTVFTVVLLPLIGISGAAIAFVIGNALQASLAYRFIEKEIGFSPQFALTQAWKDGRNFVIHKMGKK